MRRFGHQLFFFFLISFSLALATTYPLTLSDNLGNELSLMAEPMRIISMIPSQTETVCALNACEKLIAVDDFSNYPPEVNDLPKLGSAFSPNLEALVALEPDLVLVEEYSGIADSLRELGIPVYVGTAQSYDDIFVEFNKLGMLINREAEAAVLIGQVQGAVAAVEDLLANHAPKTVYFELDATPYSVGPSSFIGELLSKAGGQNIVTEAMGEFPQLDPEFVVASDPAVILLADAPYGESAETLAARAGWNTLTALETGSVFELSQEQVDISNRPGPRIAEAIELFARLIHGIY